MVLLEVLGSVGGKHLIFRGEWILKEQSGYGNFLRNRDHEEQASMLLLWLFNNIFLQCVTLLG